MLPSELNQKYELHGTLGAGAMGTVFDAMDRVIERRVAIKVVKRPSPHDPDGAEAHARFRREAQAAGRLTHPNIVGVYDYGENAEQAWIVMELVEGGSLKNRLDRQERFTIPDIVRLMDQVLAALAYSHGRGVVHRDIKPANIMLTADGTVKIADFGIARLENSSMTQLGQMIGTPAYMAPEQFRGETVDLRADIWAAGVVLYQLLTGDKPFDGGFNTVMHKALNTEPVPPSQLSVTAPRSFDAVIARAMAKRPEDRFPDARAFAGAIHAAASAQAAQAMPSMPQHAAPNADATIVTTGAVGGLPPLPGMSGPGVGHAPAMAGPAPSTAATRPAKPAKPPGGGGGKGLVIAIVLGVLLLAGGGGGYWFFVLEHQPIEAERQRLEAEARAAAERVRLEAERIARQEAETEAQRRAREAAAAQAEAARLRAEREAADAALRAAQQREREAQTQAERERLATERAAAEAAQRAAQQREEAERQRVAREQAERARLERERIERERAQTQTQTQTPQIDSSGPTALDLRAAGQAIAQMPCSLLTWSSTDRLLTIAGAVRRGEEAAIASTLAGRGIPASALRLELQSFGGPYCPALDTFRPLLAPLGGAPRAELVGQQPLAKGELMRIDVEMPPWPAHLYIAYFMSSGEVAHLVPSRLMAPGQRLRIGEPTATDPGFPVDEPYGTDLAVIIASDRPLFPAGRPVVEQQAVYLAALSQAVASQQASGARIQVRPVVIETVERRPR